VIVLFDGESRSERRCRQDAQHKVVGQLLLGGEVGKSKRVPLCLHGCGGNQAAQKHEDRQGKKSASKALPRR